MDEKRKFLEAEEIASQLVEKLKALHNEATSYTMAKEDFETVRQHLVKLIKSMTEVVTNSDELVKRLKDMESGVISKKIDESRELIKTTGQTVNESKTLIETTGKTVDSSHEIVQDLKKGEPGILSRLDETLDRLDTSKALVTDTKILVTDSHQIVKDMKERGEPEILNRLSKLKTFILITVICSIVALVISIISILS